MSETSQDKQEAARVRRRWLTLGELLAIAGVVISGLALWNSYRERANGEVERIATEARSTRSALSLLLRATVEKDGNALALVPRDPQQTVQAQTLRFPASLGLAPVETTGDPRIERSWFEHALTEKLEHANTRRRVVGDARLPVLITTRFLVDGAEHEDRALYDIGYTLGHGFLSGTTIRLSGLSRVGPVKDEAAGEKGLEALAKGRLG